ncbi:MAG: hypothetical protein A3G25_07985 [Betaproteobacteria bacterium RIFCSPLOWO2_12_FULL_63_13]|nr:MAG: hypothetical protein A3H32_00305 [Betaproteobacteria bacterium RIFCSPLOWO2_02_FULL_63_19]OGA44054.1 MAG: hypothetical protein A3G25_07985 [Betaproteobacteria bacterium RIFCSPLOWO2_12_FULL_63_13]
MAAVDHVSGRAPASRHCNSVGRIFAARVVADRANGSGLREARVGLYLFADPPKASSLAAKFVYICAVEAPAS